MAGDGLQLICRYNRMSFAELAHELQGYAPVTAARPKVLRTAGRIGPMADEDKAKRLTRIWSGARLPRVGDQAMKYLAARVPGLDVEPSPALRLAMLDYWHEEKVLGKFPTIIAKFTLPDGPSNVASYVPRCR